MLVLGSSLLRNLDESRIADAEVRCLPGGKAADIKRELDALATQKRRYSKVVLLVGGNDVSVPPEEMDLEEVVSTYRAAVTSAKAISDHVVVS